VKNPLRHSSFGAKLLTAFVLVIALTTLAGYFYINLSVDRAFTEFISGRNSAQDRALFNSFRFAFMRFGDMEALLEALHEAETELPAVITNAENEVVFTPDPRAVRLGQRLDSELVGLGIPFSSPDERTWTFLSARLLVGLEVEDAYLRRAKRSLWLAGLTAGIGAILLSFLLIRQLTGPLRRLDQASRAVAAGRFDERIDIDSSDELGRLATSFNEMSASLAASEVAKKQMIADISHELRTPITAIRTTIEGLRDGLIEPSEEALTALHERILLTTRLVSDLHQLALADAGRLSMHPMPCRIDTVLETIQETIGVQLEDERIELETEISSALPAVLVDRQRIEQVLLNLLSNAIRHTPEGGNLRVLAKTEGQSEIRVSVCDSGPGLSPEDLEHVFDRFYRADQARTASDSGTGLGLPIAKALIEAHGGRMYAENLPDRGACFSFTLPIADA